MGDNKKLTAEQRETLCVPDSRMDAYYYSFDRTGVAAIDAILSAVAYAGKAFHGTDQWYQTDVNYGPITGGTSAVDLIQAAANEAADKLLVSATPREIHTVAELDALPTQSVVLDGDNQVWRKSNALWDCLDLNGDQPREESKTVLWQSREPSATVLFTPTSEEDQ